MSEQRPGAGRRGRLPLEERASRKQTILDHALDELLEHGVDGLSMLGVAKRAGASKETLYSWFGSRNGLLTALIERNADGAAQRVHDAIHADADVQSTLIGFATGLITLLTSDASIALNRTAFSSPDLAELLLRSGRYRVGPIVENYLASLDQAGTLHAPDPPAAFELLYGLIIQDVQIRVLLGDDPPTRSAIKQRAERAIADFLTLTTLPNPAMR